MSDEPALDQVAAFAWMTLLGSIVLQFLFFTCAAGFKMDKVTDLVYGMNFVALAFAAVIWDGSYTLRQVITCALVACWGVRLAAYLFYRILLIGNDARFDGTRENPFKFFIWFMLQAVTVWVVSLPFILLCAVGGGRGDCNAFDRDDCKPRTLPEYGPVDVQALDVVGWVLFFIGFLFEAIGDWQKFTFKNDSANRGEFIRSGLWRFTRHPNYFGDMVCWWATVLPCIAVFEAPQYLSLIGPFFITVNLMCGSGIPTTEKSADKRYWDREDYQDYKANTPVCFPFPPILGCLPPALKTIFCCEYRFRYEFPPEYFAERENINPDAEKGKAKGGKAEEKHSDTGDDDGDDDDSSSASASASASGSSSASASASGSPSASGSSSSSASASASSSSSTSD